ncbi:3-ketoacyl-CoA thiolase, mitochondrial-like [Corticium candelabrum]|uniref:3-ketoacyl-CoA thiolase, mitochondrial-like n=1 Tax=Corticium candelabrum TaxID=121492 RepID=UPI002E2620C1|nr:3-ketoacyl-CoA thiolase, mitochondrial-like [Corticium candelabrum]
MATRRAVFIVAAKRTPFGTFGGKLKNVNSTDLAAHASKAALEAGNVAPETVDSVVFGNVIQSSTHAPFIARHVGLMCGIPQTARALTVNRLCGSGFQAIVSGYHEICLSEAEIVLTGGSENMSLCPFSNYTARFGTKLGVGIELEDTLWAGLKDSYVNLPMGVTAENLAEQYDITREQCDRYAHLTQSRWARANEEGRFNAEIAPVTLKGKRGDDVMSTDEHPKPSTTVEGLAKLPTVFKKGGTVTAGNASGISDGAGALILASEEAVKKHNLSPLARLVSHYVAGVDPKIMGIGPVPAIKGALSKAGLYLSDMKLIEVNEAFAPQYLAVEKELGLKRETTNTNGGAIALGHPVGASGARITGHLVHELRRVNGQYAVGSACIGGGQGIAVVIERV